MPGRPFVLGVQWHPEDMTAHSESARRLFHGLVQSASRTEAAAK
jgi:gamma-glutamyl-gamma-aminobutyrate hydrolase PuuD